MLETLKIIVYYFLALFGVLFGVIFFIILGPTLQGASPTPPPVKLTFVDYLHPSLSIPSVLLVVTAYFLKKGRKERFLAHYVAGILAVVTTLTAFVVALAVIDGNSQVPPWSSVSTLPLHLFVALLLIVPIIIVHGAMGMSMLLFGRKAGKVSIHKRLAKWVVVIYLIQGAFGLSVLFFLDSAFAHL